MTDGTFKTWRQSGVPIRYMDGPNAEQEITEQGTLQEGMSVLVPNITGGWFRAEVTSVQDQSAEARSENTVAWLRWAGSRERWVADGMGNLRAITQIRINREPT